MLIVNVEKWIRDIYEIWFQFQNQLFFVWEKFHLWAGSNWSKPDLTFGNLSSALYYLDCSWNVTCAHTKVYRFTAVWKWRSQKEIKFSSEQFHHQASEAMFPI